jgi:hypothetical protein
MMGERDAPIPLPTRPIKTDRPASLQGNLAGMRADNNSTGSFDMPSKGYSRASGGKVRGAHDLVLDRLQPVNVSAAPGNNVRTG